MGERVSEHGVERLEQSAWRARIEAHEVRLAPLLGDYVEGRGRGLKDPVRDFLFEYYSFRPARLGRWTPGLGVVLEGAGLDDLALFKGVEVVEGGVGLLASGFPAHRREGAAWILGLLKATRGRAPFSGCYGMHEWAMVYRAEAVRHEQVPMRMSPEALAAFVESRPVVCSHYDAFRFFTPEARPLNRHQPTFEAMSDNEQPGCLHANMDLYRWSYKLYPWIASELIVDAFELAMEARVIDMRASPYDLSGQGFDAIPLETPEGRRQYQELQADIARRGAPLRDRLIAAYERLLALVPVP